MNWYKNWIPDRDYLIEKIVEIEIEKIYQNDKAKISDSLKGAGKISICADIWPKPGMIDFLGITTEHTVGWLIFKDIKFQGLSKICFKQNILWIYFQGSASSKQ